MQQINNGITPLRANLLACKVMVKYILICGCAVNLLMLTTPLYSMQVLDRVLSSGNLDTLSMLTLVILLALALLSLIQAARSFAMTKMGSWFEKRLSYDVFANSVRTALESKANANSQQMRDLQTVKTYLTSPGLVAILDTPWAIIFLIVLFMLHVYIGMLAVIGGVVLIIVGLMGDKATKPLIEATNETLIRSMRQVDQVTRNAEVIEVMGLLPNVNKSWQNINNDVQRMQSLATKRQAVFTEVTKFIRLILQIAVTGLGAYLFVKEQGAFSSGSIIASSSLVSRALAPFEVAITSWKGYVNCKKAYQRLNTAFSKYSAMNTVMSLPEPEGKIEMESVYYAPPGSQKHIVKGVSIAVEAGEMLAIIGASGSGKTSIAKLIVGALHPTIGTVRIDGASIRDWNRQELGKNIGYLPQDIELFSGTIRENIGRMDPNAHHEDVIIAAQLAGVHDMILQLPKGYDTEIGFDGSTLSGGQKQRIGLARAFFGSPKMLVLDEPNASLDSYGEAALASALEYAKEQKITSTIISHRSSILSIIDKIMVMRDGMVVMFGPRKQVIEEMQKMQKGQQSFMSVTS